MTTDSSPNIGVAPKRLRNYVAIVLDESGSMDSMRQEAIDAFNEQAKAISHNSIDQDTVVSLVKFNTAVPNPVFWNLPAQELLPITRKDYRPSGLTAMLDAIGLTINRLAKQKDANDEHVSFLVVIISDGYENNSKRYTYPKIAERITRLQATDRWTFAYLGANQDLSLVAQETGIPLGNTRAFIASAEGMREAGRAHSAASDRFLRERAAGVRSSNAFYNDADDQQRTETTQPGEFWEQQP